MSRAMQSQRVCGGSWNHTEDLRARQCPPYCSCEFPEHRVIAEHKGQISELCECRCGEEDPGTHELQWRWHKHSDSDVDILGANVTFHPTYSQGTAIIRGDKSLEAGMVHHWEIRILTAMSGTDVMFGIGTDKMDLTKYKFHFISALGIDPESWGLSYTGKFTHNGLQSRYCQPFSQGCIIGLCLDRSRGTLEYFLNRRPLGITFSKVAIDSKVTIYPMVSSTTARSAIRLINATSQVDCLQLRAYQTLAKQPKGLEQLKKMPGFTRVTNSYWFLAPPVRYSSRNPANEYDLLDEAVISLKTRLGRKQKYKGKDAEDDDDVYSNAAKMALRRGHPPWDPFYNQYLNYYLGHDNNSLQ